MPNCASIPGTEPGSHPYLRGLAVAADGSIYVADSNGNKVALLHPKGINRGDGTFYPFVAGLGAKGEFMATPFPPKRWYRLTMPNAKNSNASANALSEKVRTVAAR